LGSWPCIRETHHRAGLLGGEAGASTYSPCLKSADSAAKAGLPEALLTLVTATISIRLHPRAALYLCAARLIPLRKKDGGIRPIAVGDTLRRLVAKWLLASGFRLLPLPRSKQRSQRGAPARSWAWECRPRWMSCTGARVGSCCRWTEKRTSIPSHYRQSLMPLNVVPSMMPWVRQALQPAPLL